MIVIVSIGKIGQDIEEKKIQVVWVCLEARKKFGGEMNEVESFSWFSENRIVQKS